MQPRSILPILVFCAVSWDLAYGAEDPATLILKSSANFLPDTHLLPKKLESVLNDESFSGKPSEATVNGKKVTIYKQALGAPWDTIVYGKKRSSYTVFSYESWYPDAILDNVGALNPFVQWRLAAGILASNVVGDESVHVGHFMAQFDSQKDKNIVDIVRVDLNARERFARARQEKNRQSPYHASSFYQKSGKYNKDYVSYLLADKTLDLIYTMLWVNLASKGNPSEIVKKESGEALRKQLDDLFQQEINKVPEKYREKSVSDILGSKKEKAILDILAIVNKDANEPLKLDSLRRESSIADIVSTLDAQRVIVMIKEARRAYDAYMNKLQADVLKLKLTDKQNLLRLNALRLTDKIVKRNENAGDTWKLVDDLHTEMLKVSKEKVTDELFARIALDSKIALGLAEATYLSQDFPEGSMENGEIRTLQTVIDLAEYGSQAKNEDRKKTAWQLLNKALDSPNLFWNALKNPEVTDAITLNKGVLVNTTNKNGERLIKKLQSRHKPLPFKSAPKIP